MWEFLFRWRHFCSLFGGSLIGFGGGVAANWGWFFGVFLIPIGCLSISLAIISTNKYWNRRHQRYGRSE